MNISITSCNLLKIISASLTIFSSEVLICSPDLIFPLVSKCNRSSISSFPHILFSVNNACATEVCVSGSFSSNYADIKDKNVIIVDDVVGTGDTFMSAIKTIKAEKGNPSLCLAVLNKKKKNDIEGIPLRALIRARVI